MNERLPINLVYFTILIDTFLYYKKNIFHDPSVGHDL